VDPLPPIQFWVLRNSPLAAAHAGEQPAVHIADQTDPERELAQLVETPFERVDVVEDLLHIRIWSLAARLHFEDVRQRRLRALDASGRKRLAHEIRPDQQMWISHQLPDAREPSQ
jgi:hypothetical protein